MFVSKIRASGVDDRSPWGDFWFEPVTMRTAAGARVSADSALRLTAVFACVRLLAGTMASLPFRLYRVRDDGGKQWITDHWLYRLMARRPNRWQTPFEWRQMMSGHFELRGNAYNRIYANRRGEIEELVPLHPDKVRMELLDNGSYRYRLRQPDGSEEVVGRGEIWHLRAFSTNGYIGLNPIEVARESIGVGLAMQDFAARFFANDARPMGGWIEFPGQFKDKESRNVWRESWQAAQAGQNRGKTAVLESGMKYHEVGLNNKDSQFIEAQQLKVTDIARLFGVPPHLIADLSKATFSNIEQQSLEYVKFSMTPRVECWESSIEYFLTPEDGLEVELDLGNLERGDSKARAEYYSKGILDGWLTRNEARIAENLNPLDGLDEPLEPLNMQNAGEEAEPDAPEPDADDSEPPAPADARAPTRGEQLEAAAADRVVRKEVTAMRRNYEKLLSVEKRWREEAQSFYASHASFVAETLAMPEHVAKAYCGTQLAELMAATDDEVATKHARIPAVLDAWESSRAAELVLIARGERLTPNAVPAVHVHVQVGAPTVNVPAATHHIDNQFTIENKVEPARPATKTVISERLPDGTIISKVSEQ